MADLSDPRLFMRAVLSPVVYVCSSKPADGLCRRNGGLTFAQLLRPFADVDVPALSRGGSSTMWVRCVALDEVSWPARLISARLKAAVARHTHTLEHGGMEATSEAETVSQEPTVAEALAAYESADASDEVPSNDLTFATPWYDSYRSVFFEHLLPEQHEFLNHPWTVICVATTSEPDPAGSLAGLFSPQEPPVVFRQKRLDATIPRVLILLHDATEQSEEDAKRICDETSRKLGTDVKLVTINSYSGAHPPMPSRLWEDFLHALPPRTAAPVSAGDDQATPSTTAQTTASSEHSPSDAPSMPGGKGNDIFDDDEADFAKAADPLTAMLREEEGNDGSGNADGEYLLVGDEGDFGCRLSQDDAIRLRMLVSDIAKTVLVPYLRQTAQHLNTVINNAKRSKGFFSATRKFFGGSSTSPSSSPQSGQNASANDSVALELQMRKLADVSILLQDYEQASSLYNTIRKDFANDKLWRHSAAAQELLGVALYLQDAMHPAQSSRSDYMRHFEGSIMTYLSKCNDPLYATRASLFAAEILKSKRYYKQAASTFVRMCADDLELQGAVLLEQAALCYATSQPPSRRRAGFHLVLAGFRYNRSGLKGHTLRCYTQALRLYKGLGWRLVLDHINDVVGKQARALDFKQLATMAFGSLLGHSDQTNTQQEGYLLSYLTALESQSTGQSLPELVLPSVIDNACSVIFLPPSGRRSHGHHSRQASVSNDVSVSALTANMHGPAPISGEEDEDVDLPESAALWMAMEAAAAGMHSCKVVHCAEYMGPTTDNSTRPVCVVQEPVLVTCTLKNPLHLPLTLHDVALLCTHTPEGSEQPTEQDKKGADATGTTAAFEVQQKDQVILAPDTQVNLQLSVRPLTSGQLDVHGIKMTLDHEDGSVTGMLPLNVRGKRLNRTRDQQRTVSYGPDYRLQPRVIPAMPRLAISLSFKSFVGVGEICNGVINITNKGACPASDIVLTVAVPGFVFVPPEMVSESKVQLVGPSTSQHSHSDAHPSATPRRHSHAKDRIYCFRVSTGGGKLDIGASMDLPISVFLQPDTASLTPKGNYTADVCVLATCVGDQKHKLMPYRAAHAAKSCTVVPVMDVVASAQYSADSLDDMYLTMRAYNRTGSHHARLVSVRCQSSEWHLERVAAAGGAIEAATPAVASTEANGEGGTRSESTTASVASKQSRLVHFLGTRVKHSRTAGQSAPDIQASVSLQASHINVPDAGVELDEASIRAVDHIWTQLLNEASNKYRSSSGGSCDESTLTVGAVWATVAPTRIIGLSTYNCSEDKISRSGLLSGHDSIVVALSAPSVVKHDLDSGKQGQGATIPVTVRLRGLAPGDTAVIETFTSVTSASIQLYWVGKTRCSVTMPEDASDTTADLDLTATAIRPGTIDIKPLIRVSVAGRHVVHVQSQCLIRVETLSVE